MELEADYVRNALARLRAAGADTFGATGHHFLLNPPMPETDVVAFERKHSVSLPSDYRRFLTDLGNGGAGPYYGISPLGLMDQNNDLGPWREQDGFVGVLSNSFPLASAWNDLVGMPPKELLETDTNAYDRQLEEFEMKYWSTSHVDGAFPICHEGCALRIWLVLTGEQAGRLWHDGRADNTGISPVLLADGSPATFSEWYAEWLEENLKTLAASG